MADIKSSNINISKSNEKLSDTISKSSNNKISEISRSKSDGMDVIKETRQRRIIAEDPEWNLASVTKLTDLCINVLVNNFEKKPVLKGLPEKYRDIVIDSISIDLPLAIAAPLIPDQNYWKRRSKSRFQLASVCDHGNCWKRLFFELFLQSEIENFVPMADTAISEGKVAQLKESLNLGSPYIETLHLRQLKPLYVVPQPDDEEKAMSDTKTDSSANSPLDHINLSVILSSLQGLKQFQVYYGVKDCGIDFSWKYFGMTMKDAISLSLGLKGFGLEKLIIQASCIDDDKCRLLCHALLTNTKLHYLDFSHNKISNSGARGLAKLISAPLSNLKTLKLANNQISNDGVKVLGKALQQNANLKHLDLRLNHLQDQGGYSLMVLLLGNKSISSLDISGNGLDSKSVTALCALLKLNSSTLTHLDLSCNKLGNYSEKSSSNTNLRDVKATDVTGKQIFEAIAQNKYISSIDLRTTGISPEFLVAIQGIAQENGSF